MTAEEEGLYYQLKKFYKKAGPKKGSTICGRGGDVLLRFDHAGQIERNSTVGTGRMAGFCRYTHQHFRRDGLRRRPSLG